MLWKLLSSKWENFKLHIKCPWRKWISIRFFFLGKKDLGEYVFEILKILKQLSCIDSYLYQKIFKPFGKTKHTNIGSY